MDTQPEKKILLTISPQSIMLAKQARAEQQETGHITVMCPLCQKHPRITTTSRGERTTIACPCGYIISAEINF